MTGLLRSLRAPGRDERGATSIEYAFLAALIAMAIVLAVTAVGQRVGQPFETVWTELTDASTP
jgi:Flp pilus assembly pilin Flp